MNTQTSRLTGELMRELTDAELNLVSGGAITRDDVMFAACLLSPLVAWVVGVQTAAGWSDHSHKNDDTTR
jgi:hypothetical protein